MNDEVLFFQIKILCIFVFKDFFEFERNFQKKNIDGRLKLFSTPI